MPIKRCPLGSPECALFIVAQLLLRLLGGKSSVAIKTHSGEQKSNSKGQQALVNGCEKDHSKVYLTPTEYLGPY
ncbi:hypothetical protein CKO50_17615 [Pseudoalteromonas sp. HM-SA03]|nr:hypothetical protein CKO50_17615 [Pseudoalteromonas sp. HM-SA03]